MRGVKLQVKDIMEMPLGTRLIVNRTGKYWSDADRGESLEFLDIEITPTGHKMLVTRATSGWFARVVSSSERSKNGFKVDYYQYIDTAHI